jgi:hypothetical protein
MTILLTLLGLLSTAAVVVNAIALSGVLRAV